MRFRQFASLICTLIILSSLAAAQTVPNADAAERAKKKKELDEQVVTMLDRTIADVSSLRLPGNRAVVYAMSGDLYWRFDAKRSRELFRSAAAEVTTYNGEAEKEKLDNVGQGTQNQFEVFDPGDPRVDVLNLVGQRDAELALELMGQTRPASLADAMARAAQQMPKADGIQNYDPDRARASQEAALEQRFIMLAALSDPEKAAKAIKESLAKGISMSVVTLLNQVFQKDEKRAADLSSDVVKKIVDTDLTKNSDDLNGALGFLTFLTRPPLKNPNPAVKIFAFTDAQAKEIAGKLVNTFMQPSPPAFVSAALGRAMSAFEKLVPDKVLLLKQREALNKKTTPTPPRPPQPGSVQWNPNGTPEDILAAAAKQTDSRQKVIMYRSAAAKIGQIADEARAKRIVDQIPDAGIRAEASDRLEQTRLNRLTAEGNLDEIRRSIANLTSKKLQIQRLVALAGQFQRKGGEKNNETAGTLMSEAKGLANPFPEDEEELGDLMELIRGYAVIEPDVAFRMIEPLIEQFNDIIQATAVLSKYNKRDRSFKRGEMVMRVGGQVGLQPFRYVQQMQLLGKADLERMNLLVDRFGRSDARTIMKLYVIQGYLRNPQIAPFPQSFE